MDELPTRNIVEAHAKAVVDGDMDKAAADFAPDLRNDVNELASRLPQPTTDADIEKFEMGDDHADVRIRYSNDDTNIAVRTRWEEVDGRPMIVDAAPADD